MTGRLFLNLSNKGEFSTKFKLYGVVHNCLRLSQTHKRFF